MIEIVETYQKYRSGNESYDIKIKRGDEILVGMSASDSLSECPEDAMLFRDLGFIFNAEDFFNIGYEAGKSGEDVKRTIIHLNSDDEEITPEQYDNL